MLRSSLDSPNRLGTACLAAFVADCTAARFGLGDRAQLRLVEPACGLAAAHIPDCLEQVILAVFP